MSKSGRQCTVCNSKHRHQIEIGLTHGVPARVLAARFGFKRHDAILRHARAHLTAAQRAAILSAQKPTAIDLDALRTAESEGLLASLVAQRARLQAKADMAMEWGDVKGSITAEGAILANLGMVGKLLGQLVQVHDVRHMNLLISPDYLRLRSTLIDALRPYPEAARAVGAALHRLESDAAKDITAASRKPAAPIVIDHVPALSPCPVPLPC